MIQGVALGLLASKIPNFIEFTVVAVVAIFYIVLTLVALVVVWQEYVLAAQEFWWEIRWWDSFIPFMLGLGEFLMIEYLGKGPAYPAWFLSAGFTTVAGYGAYVNYAKWIKKSDFDQPKAFELFEKEVKRGRIFLLIFTLVNVASCRIILWWANTVLVFFLGCVSLVLLGYMIRQRHVWQKKALSFYGWKR